jgi:hypothetical protein
MTGQIEFFDVGDRLAELSKKGDPLERLSRTADFELFRAELEQAVPRSDPIAPRAGVRPLTMS